LEKPEHEMPLISFSAFDSHELLLSAPLFAPGGLSLPGAIFLKALLGLIYRLFFVLEEKKWKNGKLEAKVPKSFEWRREKRGEKKFAIGCFLAQKNGNSLAPAIKILLLLPGK